MKIVRKGNKYEKVTPLPKGWLSLNLVSRLKDVDNEYQKSYERLAHLLENGWSFCSREKYRKAEKSELKNKNKSKNKSKNK